VDQQGVRASIIGFNGTLTGKRAETASKLKEAWLLSKVKSSKSEAIDYLIAYKQYEIDCLRLFMELRSNG
jgi:hypothetical protein